MSRASLPAVTCPHCGGRTTIRTSSPVSPLTREVRYRCENDECGHVFAADLSIIRTLVPSARPNPAIKLPLANQNLVGARKRPANDDERTPANDDAPEAARVQNMIPDPG